MTHKTNIEKIEQLMKFSDNGALMQVFIMTAIEKYSLQIEQLTDEKWTSQFINLDAWKSCANEALSKLDN